MHKHRHMPQARDWSDAGELNAPATKRALPEGPGCCCLLRDEDVDPCWRVQMQLIQPIPIKIGKASFTESCKKCNGEKMIGKGGRRMQMEIARMRISSENHTGSLQGQTSDNWFSLMCAFVRSKRTVMAQPSPPHYTQHTYTAWIHTR